MSTPPNLGDVVATLNGAAVMLSRRVEAARKVAELANRLASIIGPLEEALTELASVDAQIKAANIDATVAALKAFQNSLNS